MSAFLGLRGTGDWVTNQLPETWREGILHEYPNGQAPLTAMLGMMNSEAPDSAKFHWFTKALPQQAGAVTGVYTDIGLSSAYSSGGVSGDILFIKMAEALSDEIRKGHTVLLRDASDLDVDVAADVISSNQNGASSYIKVALLEDDDNSSSHDLSDCDRAMVIGSAQAEGSPMPDTIAYDVTEYDNYTQIFETPLELTRTAQKSKLRTGPAYDESKRECLELHSIEMEKAFIWGVYKLKTGVNGKPKRFTRGIVQHIKANASSNVVNFQTDTNYSGQTWMQGGEHFLDTYLEQVFRHGSNEKMGICGSGALLGLQRLVKAVGYYPITSKTKSYGIQVGEWVTPFGTLYLKSHPLFNYETTTRNTNLIVDMKYIKEKPLDNTFFNEDDSDRKGGQAKIDGKKESYLTETGLEVHYFNAHMLMNGVGLDSTV
jgi:hypothetical protein